MNCGNVFVRYIKVPLTVKGVTTPNPDGTFSVYINADLPEEAQRAALEHELYHIEHDHLYNLDTVAINELEANKRMPFPAAVPLAASLPASQNNAPPLLSSTRKGVPFKPCSPRPKRTYKRRILKPFVEPDDLDAYNKMMLLKMEEKWLYDV